MPRRDGGATKEPLVLWWMPLLSLATPIVFAAWRAVNADDGALQQFGAALVWPGVALYLATLAVIWAGWKIELD